MSKLRGMTTFRNQSFESGHSLRGLDPIRGMQQVWPLGPKASPLHDQFVNGFNNFCEYLYSLIEFAVMKRGIFLQPINRAGFKVNKRKKAFR